MPTVFIKEAPAPTIKLLTRTVQDLARVTAAWDALPNAMLAHEMRLLDKPSELDAQLRTLSMQIDRVRRKMETASARPRTGSKLADLVSKNELVPSARFVELMHFTKQALSKALAARRIFFLEVEGQRQFPAFFADSRYERTQLERVSQQLGDLPGSAKWQFFTTPKASLAAASPLEALATGRYAEVRVAAEGFAER